MATTDLVELIQALTPPQQDAVRQFVAYLQEKPARPSFLDAIEEFTREHPALLAQLAK